MHPFRLSLKVQASHLPMELPILLMLPLPVGTIRTVTQFLWKPHPTALLIKELYFHRCRALDTWNHLTVPPYLQVGGNAVRAKCVNAPYPLLHETQADGIVDHISFAYDSVTGEHIPFPWQLDYESGASDDSDYSYEGELEDIWY